MQFTGFYSKCVLLFLQVFQSTSLLRDIDSKKLNLIDFNTHAPQSLKLGTVILLFRVAKAEPFSDFVVWLMVRPRNWWLGSKSSGLSQ